MRGFFTQPTLPGSLPIFESYGEYTEWIQSMPAIMKVDPGGREHLHEPLGELPHFYRDDTHRDGRCYWVILRVSLKRLARRRGRLVSEIEMIPYFCVLFRFERKQREPAFSWEVGGRKIYTTYLLDPLHRRVGGDTHGEAQAALHAYLHREP